MNIVQKLIEADSSSSKQILIVGDGMMDVYVHGRLESKCQEGCAKFVEERRITAPGGAANAVRSVSHWHTEVLAFTRFGPGGPTKTRFMEDGHCIFRYDDDRVDFDQSMVREEAINALLYRPRRVDAVLLSDYDKGMLTPEFIKEVAHTCREIGIPCVADCKRNMTIYDGCIVKGNARYWGSYPLPRDGVATYGPDPPSVGIGVAGAVLPSVQCINHVGAGDCFAAHMTLALAHGFSLQDAAAIAHSAGRVYVQHPHNRPPRPKEIAEDMDKASS